MNPDQLSIQGTNQQLELINIVGEWMLDHDNDVMPVVDDVIAYEDMDQFSPVVSFMMSLGQTEQVTDTFFRWPESRAETFQTACSDISVVGAGVEQQVTLQMLAAIGQTLYHGATRQKFRVTSFVSRTSSATVCKITRFPTSLATVAVTAPVLRVMPLTRPEGAFYPIGHGSRPTWHNNIIGITANSVGVTETMKGVKLWTGDQLRKDIKEGMQQHKGNNERAFLFGTYTNEFVEETNELGFTSQGQLREPEGLDSRIQTHRTPYAVLDKKTFNSWVNVECFGSRNSGPKYALLVCGSQAMQDLNDIAEQPLVNWPGTEKMGLDIKQWVARGDRTLAIIEEREFMDLNEESGSIWKVNPDNISICHIHDWFTKLFATSLPNQDAETLVIRSEWGPKVKLEKQFAKLFNQNLFNV